MNFLMIKVKWITQQHAVNSACESGAEETTPPNARKCRCTAGTMNQQSDSAFNPTVHKSDVNAGILAPNSGIPCTGLF
jgi:hypothetical protein